METKHDPLAKFLDGSEGGYLDNSGVYHPGKQAKLLRRIKPSRKARPPIPAPQRHRDRKNDYARQSKHRLKEA